MLSSLLLLATLAQAPLDGSYIGSLTVQGTTLRLGLELKTTDGKLAAQLTSIDQGFAKLPPATTKWDGSTLQFAVPTLGISFTGQPTADRDRIPGKFTQGLTFDLTFLRVAEIPRPNRPQEPKPPLPYQSLDVSFPGGDPGITLAATLTIPNTPPRGAILLIAGSGPNNRDAALASHRPFLVLADALTRLGFAVLRYDKRGVSPSTGDFKSADIPAFARDAAAALTFLRSRKDTGNRHILLGHSEGGLLAPWVAAKDPNLSGIALLAAPAVTGEQILRRQIPALGLPDSFLQGVEASLPNNAPLRYFWSYDPLPTLAKVSCPVLAMTGTLDLQVALDQNLPLIEDTLRKAGNKAVTVRSLPKVNHILQAAQTGKQDEYGRIEETIAPVVLDELRAWLQKLLPTPPKP